MFVLASKVFGVVVVIAGVELCGARLYGFWRPEKVEGVG